MTDRVYNSYIEAMAQCGDGYEDRELARVVFDKTVHFPKTDLLAHTHEWLSPALFGVAYAARNRTVVRVIDFGGQYGLHQDVLKLVFADIETRWAVVETEPFVENGRRIASANRQWFTTITAAHSWLGSVDLIFCSGVLQSMPSPAAALSEIVAQQAPLILWQRLALTKSSEPITVVQISRLADNGPGPLPDGIEDREVRYPLTYYPETAFIDSHHGYRLLCQPRDHHLLNVGGHTVFHGAAFLFLADGALKRKPKSSFWFSLFGK